MKSDHGIIIVRLESVKESVRDKKGILYLFLAETIVFPVMIGLVIYLFDQLNFFTILLIIIFFFISLSTDLIAQYWFSRSMGPITIYSSGIELPQAWIHKLMRKQPFIEKERLSDVQSYLPDRNYGVGPCLILYIKDKKGWKATFGVRRKEEAERFLEYAAKDWAVNVEMFSTTANR